MDDTSQKEKCKVVFQRPTFCFYYSYDIMPPTTPESLQKLIDSVSTLVANCTSVDLLQKVRDMLEAAHFTIGTLPQGVDSTFAQLVKSIADKDDSLSERDKESLLNATRFSDDVTIKGL